MRHARQDSPVSAVSQAGQASNSASGVGNDMRASCRNGQPVVAACGADYHLRMSSRRKLEAVSVEQGGPAGRVVLRQSTGNWTDHWIVAGYRGPSLPASLAGFSIEPSAAAAGGTARWRISSEQGEFEFEARAVDHIRALPALYKKLHRPFELTATGRLAVGLLLALLRFPGGERLISRWHSRRNA
jgi:hypothetical protein